MALAEKYIPYYTYDDWLHWEGRWELIEGIAIAMSPMPIPEHQRVAGNMLFEFKQALKGKCNTCIAYLPIDYKVSDDTIVQPDLLITCKEIEKKYLDFPPSLVVEILSPSTTLKDRNTKYQIYEQQGVKYYLIVDVNQKRMEIYQLINGKYELQQYMNEFEFQLEENCILSPQLDDVWE